MRIRPPRNRKGEWKKYGYISFSKREPEKAKEYNKKYQLDNKERLKIRQKIYRDSHKDIASEYSKRYRQKRNEELKELSHNYYQLNKEKIKARVKQYSKLNRKEKNAYNRLWNANNWEQYLATSKTYRFNHKEELNNKVKIRLKARPELRFRHRLSNRIRIQLRNFLHTKKEYKTYDYLGCNISILKEYIESQFTEGMSWDNYGKWHIDHRICCAYFLNQPNPDFKLFYNYRNLQPMWAKENIQKGSKLLPNHEELLMNLRKEVYSANKEGVNV